MLALPPTAREHSAYQGDSMVTVTVDPDIFDAQGEAYPDPEEGWNGPSPVFLVQSDQTEQAAQALYRAASGHRGHTQCPGAEPGGP